LDGSAIKLEISFGFPVSRFPVKFPFSMSVLYSSISHGGFLYQISWKNHVDYITCLFVGFHVTSFARALASAYTEHTLHS